MAMRVFVAGGTGVVGRRLVPQLVARGHDVTATATSPGKLGWLENMGAEAVVMDGLDAASVGEAVTQAQPDAITHQMTAIGGKADMNSFVGRGTTITLVIPLKSPETRPLVIAGNSTF